MTSRKKQMNANADEGGRVESVRKEQQKQEGAEARLEYQAKTLATRPVRGSFPSIRSWPLQLGGGTDLPDGRCLFDIMVGEAPTERGGI
jgi:hypothetical protein